MVLSALVASSAGASIVPAKFSTPYFKMTTPAPGITVKRNGIEPKTCTFVRPAEGEAGTGSFTFYWAWNGYGLVSHFNCGLGTELWLGIQGEGTYDTVANTYTLTVKYNSGSSQLSPVGSYYQNAVAKGTWVNGSGATPSKLTFVNQQIGSLLSGGTISIDGTFNFTTSTGGLITLSH